jgi:tetratricopeptide (TPR) repeat protein
MTQDQLEQALAEVKRLAGIGQADHAKRLCRSVLQKAPLEARFWAWLGSLALAKGDLAEAEQSFHKAIELAPSNARNWTGLGSVWFRMGRAMEAESCFRKALELDDSDSLTWANLATVLTVQDKWQPAVDAFRQSVMRDDSNAEIWANLASAELKCGNVGDAKAAFERSLAITPNPDVAVEYSILLGHVNDFQSAANILSQVTSQFSSFVPAWQALGDVLSKSGDVANAEAVYRRVLELEPQSEGARRGLAKLRCAIDVGAGPAETDSSLGMTLLSEGKVDRAIPYLCRAVELHPNAANHHFNLGNALKVIGNLSEAIQCFRRAAELAPELAAVHYNLGSALREAGLLDDAVTHLQEATRLSPAFSQAHSNLAVALQEQGKLDEAIAAYRQAIVLEPGNAINYNNLGNIFKEHGQIDAAIENYRRSLALQPSYSHAYSNLGAALQQNGEFNQALAFYSRAIELEPEYADAHRNRALIRLLSGDFERGWPEYEWRWKTGEMAYREFSQPPWQGENLNGRTILIWAEQGFGDTFQFMRYAALLKERGATVIAECQKALSKVLASCQGVDQLISGNDRLPAFDFHAPLLSLPGILKTDLNKIPAEMPYLFAKETLVARWRQRLEPLKGFRIGINWSGREGRGAFRKRDIPVKYFLELANFPGVTLISLQKGAARSELSSKLPIFNPGEDFDQSHGPFMDTAAIMRNVDLVITSDTSVPHLAAALGAPVWVALPRVPDWRWLLDRADSPWYPTMRLFRQERSENWDVVFARVKESLRTMLR